MRPQVEVIDNIDIVAWFLVHIFSKRNQMQPGSYCGEHLSCVDNNWVWGGVTIVLQTDWTRRYLTPRYTAQARYQHGGTQSPSRHCGQLKFSFPETIELQSYKLFSLGGVNCTRVTTGDNPVLVIV